MGDEAVKLDDGFSEESLSYEESYAPDGRECDQCGTKSWVGWSSWQCPRGPCGSCDGKLVNANNKRTGWRLWWRVGTSLNRELSAEVFNRSFIVNTESEALTALRDHLRAVLAEVEAEIAKGGE